MPRISAYRLKHLARVYESEPAVTVPFADVLGEVGIDPDVLTTMDSRIKLIDEARVVEMACQALSDKTFAARAGLSTQGSKTLLAYLARASRTLGQVLQLAQRYYALEDPHMKFAAKEGAKGPIVVLDSGMLGAKEFPRHTEFLMFGMYKRTRQIAGPDFGELSLLLKCGDHEHCEQLSQIAGCEIEAGQSFNGLQLPPNGLAYPIPTADPALLDHLLEHGEERLRQMPQNMNGVSEKVAKLVFSRLPGHLPSGDEVAAELCMTRRTLTRRLSDEGTSYKLLADTARCDMAKRMLLGEDSIAQVAFLLDFADQAAFSVAFKRWTGTTPASFKRTHI
ncbi:AraC family transcriptional regulator ligand-binding domain-containing protein [Roseibium sp. SCPC15]|uniref:helix-turn-helix domain-containing protein n=1 Tax=Roseibium sp. SCP15 TaxID=3141376 RepID=UPI00333BEE6E